MAFVRIVFVCLSWGARLPPPTGGTQLYRTLDLKFAPLSYNANTVERRALLSATSVGGSVFVLVSGSLATRYKKLQPELLAVRESFRAIGKRAG